MTDYRFTSVSLKRFRKLPKDVQRRIVTKLDYFCSQKDPRAFAEPLTEYEQGEYRFRIGDYRVIFDIENDILVIHDIGHREDIYRR